MTPPSTTHPAAPTAASPQQAGHTTDLPASLTLLLSVQKRRRFHRSGWGSR